MRDHPNSNTAVAVAWAKSGNHDVTENSYHDPLAHTAICDPCRLRVDAMVMCVKLHPDASTPMLMALDEAMLVAFNLITR